MDKTKWLSPKDITDQFKIPEEVQARLRGLENAERKLPYQKIDNRILYLKQDIEDWVAHWTRRKR